MESKESQKLLRRLDPINWKSFAQAMEHQETNKAKTETKTGFASTIGSSHSLTFLELSPIAGFQIGLTLLQTHATPQT